MDVLVLTQHLSQSHLMRRIARDIYDHTIHLTTNSKMIELNLFKAPTSPTTFDGVEVSASSFNEIQESCE